MPRACDWFAESSTPILDVCTKLFVQWDSEKCSQLKGEEEEEKEDEREEQIRSASSTSRAFGAEFVAFIRRRCSRVDYEPEEEEEDREKGEKGTGEEKGEDEVEDIRQVTWSDIVTLGCDFGGEEFLHWVVMHSWLPSLNSCREVLKRLVISTRGDRREKLLLELARWT